MTIEAYMEKHRAELLEVQAELAAQGKWATLRQIAQSILLEELYVQLAPLED